MAHMFCSYATKTFWSVGRCAGFPYRTLREPKMEPEKMEPEKGHCKEHSSLTKCLVSGCIFDFRRVRLPSRKGSWNLHSCGRGLLVRALLKPIILTCTTASIYCRFAHWQRQGRWRQGSPKAARAGNCSQKVAPKSG